MIIEPIYHNEVLDKSRIKLYLKLFPIRLPRKLKKKIKKGKNLFRYTHTPYWRDVKMLFDPNGEVKEVTIKGGATPGRTVI